MQSESSTRVFDMWGEVPREHETIAYREPELSELIAASVVAPVPERPSQTKIDVAPPAALPIESTMVIEPAVDSARDSAVESSNLESLAELSIESTVVIASSRNVPCSVASSTTSSSVVAVPMQVATQAPAQALGQPRVRRPIAQSTSTLSPFVIERASSPSGFGSMPSMSYSISDASIAGDADREPAPLPLATRIAYALSIAVVGVVCGVVGATSLLHLHEAGAGAVRRAQPRISVDDRIPVAAAIRDKAVVPSGTKRRH